VIRLLWPTVSRLILKNKSNLRVVKIYYSIFCVKTTRYSALIVSAHTVATHIGVGDVESRRHLPQSTRHTLKSPKIVWRVDCVTTWPYDELTVHLTHPIFGRPYYRAQCLSICLSSSVTFCIVAKRYVLAKKCLKEWIKKGQIVDFLGRRHISTSGFTATRCRYTCHTSLNGLVRCTSEAFFRWLCAIYRYKDGGTYYCYGHWDGLFALFLPVQPSNR